MDRNSVTLNCLAFQLGLARKKVQRFYEDHLEVLGLNTSYVYVMEVIKEYGPCTLTSIANQLRLERATISNLLGRMERDGYIRRLPGQERRSLEVNLSDKGRSVLKQALHGLQDCDEELNNLFEGELKEIKTGIQKINEKI